ncbi:hypothetical protein D3C75_1074590 [compost metagenome]
MSVNSSPRFQPSSGITARSQPSPFMSLTIKASSPRVIPVRIGMDQAPTIDSYPSCSKPPSQLVPPSGAGRSSTSRLFPCSAQASITYSMVEI